MKFFNYPLGDNVFNAIDVSEGQVNYALYHGREALCNQQTFFEENEISEYFVNRVVKAEAHGTNVLEVEDLSFSGYDSEGAKGRGYDGVITTIPNVPLFSIVADCPQLMVAGKETVGVLHASRDAVDKGIVHKFFNLFSNYENLEDVKIGFSPYIFQGDFEHDYLNLERSAAFERHVDFRDNKFYVDLAGVIMDDLEREGIEFENIYNEKINTFDLSRNSRELGGFQVSYREHTKNPVKRGSGGLCVMLKE